MAHDRKAAKGVKHTEHCHELLSSHRVKDKSMLHKWSLLYPEAALKISHTGVTTHNAEKHTRTCGAVVGPDTDAGSVEQVSNLPLLHAPADGGCLHPHVYPPTLPGPQHSLWNLQPCA